MNEMITRSLTGVVFVSIVVFATTFDLITATVLWVAVLLQGLKEYRKLKGAQRILFTLQIHIVL